MKNLYLFAGRNVYFSNPEKPAAYSEGAMWERYAKETLVHISPGKRVDFDGKDNRGLVAKLIDVYKEEGCDDAKAKKAAMTLTAKVVMQAHNKAPGFDVNYFKKGDYLFFPGNDSLVLNYTPRGSNQPKSVIIDYALQIPENDIVFDQTRQALEGERIDVLLEACNRKVLYNVASVLGYSWGNAEHKKEFWGKMQGLGFDASAFKTSAEKNIAACNFVRELVSGKGWNDQIKSLMRGAEVTQDAPIPAPSEPLPLPAVPVSPLPPSQPRGRDLPAFEDLPQGMDPETQWERLKMTILDVAFDGADRAGISHQILESAEDIRAEIPNARSKVGVPFKAIKLSKGEEVRYVLIYKKPVVDTEKSYLRLESTIFNPAAGKVTETSAMSFMGNIEFAVNGLSNSVE